MIRICKKKVFDWLIDTFIRSHIFTHNITDKI